MTGCGSCGAANPPDFRFCGTCGAPLHSRTCPSCAFENPEPYRFCGQCGTDLDGAPQPSAPAERAASLVPAGAATSDATGERKLATVLFADVVGFTSLAERLDHETLARRVDDALQRLGEVVTAHGGTVDKYMGDSLMAVFGVPVAHDDDAERAVAAGLAMRGVVADLGFSIGINTGEVTVTPAGPSGVSVIGDAVNVAARLEKAATREQVLVGALTYELTRSRIAYRAQPPMVLKGKREPVEVWEAVRLRSGLAGTGDEPPIVGRDDELAYLRGVWRRVVSERRFAAVLVIGDPGVGKTRLLRELARSVGTEGRAVQIHYPAYASRRRALNDLIDQMGFTGEEGVDERLRSLMGDSTPELRALDPAALLEEHIWAFRRLLERAAAVQPLLLSFDGLERAMTTQLVRFLSLVTVRLSRLPVLLVLAGRPEPGLWLAGYPTATRMRLGPLGPSDSLVLAESLAPDVDWTSPSGATVLERAAGNALYIRELAAVVRAHGLEAGTSLPPTLRSVLSARLDALSASDKAALQHLALLGDTFGERDLALLDPAAPAALPGLVTLGLLRPRSSHGFEFVDPLLRDVAYESLPHSVRGERHLAASRVVADPVERARHLELAAGYLEDGPDRAEVIASMAAMGVQLLDDSRTVDGVRVLEEARRLGCDDPAALLRLARELSDTRPEDALAVLAPLPHRLPDAALDAERVHVAAGAEARLRPERALPQYDEAARRWAAIGRRDKEGWAYSNKAVALFSLGRLAETDQNLVRAIELFRVSGERAGERAANTFRAMVRPEHPEVAAWLADGLAWAEAVGDRTQQLVSVTSLAWHHVLRGRLGGAKDMVEADHWLDRATELATDLGNEGELVTALALRSHLARMRGEVDEADRCAVGARRAADDHALRPATRALREAVEYAAALANGREPAALPPRPGARDPVAAMGNVMVAEAQLLAGRTAESYDRLHGGGADWHERSELGLQVSGTTEALALLLLGRLDEAAALSERTLRASRATGAHGSLAAATAILAEACARLGERERAESVLGEADASGGLAAALVLRAQAALGDRDALRSLGEAAEALAAPGLLTGVSAAV